MKMFLSYYQLQEKPFQITTDPKFLWLGEKHQEALATLKYGVQDNKGFLLLTGDVGAGKTTLINALLSSLTKDVIIARIADPRLTHMAFCQTIAEAFQLKEKPINKAEFLNIFSSFLEEAHESGKQVLLIIDEAQRIESNLLEEIRLLSNIEKEDAKLLNIFFIGQYEFNDILLRPENRAIRQRITINYVLDHLTEEETGAYIAHRLKVAGSTRELFTPGAITEIYNFSGGAPRLINIICDRALLTGFVEEQSVLDVVIIKECARELKIRPYKQKNVEVKPGIVPGPNGNPEQKNEPEKRAPDNTPETDFEIRRPPRKKNSMLCIYCIYLLLIIVILAAVAFFFFTPDNFSLSLSSIKNILFPTSGEIQ